MEDLGSRLGYREVRIVEGCCGRESLGLLDARSYEDIVMQRVADERPALERLLEALESAGVTVDDRHVMPFLGEEPGELRTDPSAADHDHVHL